MSSSKISKELREQVQVDAQNRCGYCKSHQKYVLGLLEIEHIISKARGGSDKRENLWLACRLCNNYKGPKVYGQDPETEEDVLLFNPRTQRWSRHFAWSDDGKFIMGRTKIGRATVATLKLNNTIAIAVREAWVEAGWHPPED